jgi:cyanophycinase
MKRLPVVRSVAILTSTLLLTGAAALLPAGASAQTAVDSAAYIIRLGHDTVAVERWVRTADRLESVALTRSPRTVVRRYAVRLDGSGRVTHLLGDAGEREVSPAGAIPIVGSFYAPYALALSQAARSGAAEATVPMLAGARTLEVTVRRTAEGEYALPNQFDVPMVARLGPNHRLLFIDAGGGATVERVSWFDIDALAREFSARDERGTGLGPLSPRDTARAQVGSARVLIDYSRPSARGRTVMGALVPWGEVWRTGANETTQLITDTPLQFGAVRLEPGSYSMYTVPGEDGWELIFNRQTGMNALARDPAQDIGSVPMRAYRPDRHVEQLTITIDPALPDGVLRIEWGGHGASVRFRVPGTEPAEGAGRLVIAGGGVSRDNAALYRTVLDARHGSGPVCVIPTASPGLEGAQGSINSSVATFERHGGAGVAAGVLMSIENPEAAADAAIVERIRGCSGFYFTGGVQSRTMAVLLPGGQQSPALAAIVARHREGAVVGGSSAGAAIMSDPMIAGGSTTDALAGGVRRAAGAAPASDDDERGGVSVSAGIGFLPSAIVDQHFLARGRIGRLIAAVLDLGEFDLGFGVDENTALVVDGESVFPVGASGVIVIDARDATRAGRSASGVRLHLLGAGDSYDIGSRQAVPAGDKTPLADAGAVAGRAAQGAVAGRDVAGTGEGRAAAERGAVSGGAGQATVAGPEDVFARWSFLHLLSRFATAPQREITVEAPGVRLVLRKGDGFRAAARAGTGVQDVPAGLSVLGLTLDVHR